MSYNVQQTNAIGSYTFVTCGVEAATAHYIVSPTMLLVDTSAVPTSTASQGQVTSSSKSTAPAGASPDGSPTSSPAQPSIIASGSQQQSSVAAIAGGVVGALAVLCGSAFAIFFLVRRNRRKSEKSNSAGATGDGDDQMDDKTQIVSIGYRAQDDSRINTDVDARSELPADVMSRDSPVTGDIRSMCFSMPPSTTDSVVLPPWAASELPVQYSRMSHRAEMPG